MTNKEFQKYLRNTKPEEDEQPREVTPLGEEFNPFISFTEEYDGEENKPKKEQEDEATDC